MVGELGWAEVVGGAVMILATVIVLGGVVLGAVRWADKRARRRVGRED